MPSKFEEAFYRNKRAALLSSLATIAVSTLSIRVSPSTQIYGIQIGAEISNAWVVGVAFLVCIYLNLSYYLYYYTEVPLWARDPEQGIRQADAVRESLLEMKTKAEEEIQKISDEKLKSHKYLEELSGFVKSPLPEGIVESVERRFVNSVCKNFGDIQVATFNQLSTAINKIGGLSHSNKLNWDEMSQQSVEVASQIIAKGVKDQTEKFLINLQQKTEDIASDIQQSFYKLNELELERKKLLERELSTLSVVLNKIEFWQKAMHIRLNGQYLYFPAFCFFVASAYAIAGLVLGVPFHLIVFQKIL